MIRRVISSVCLTLCLTLSANRIAAADDKKRPVSAGVPEYALVAVTVFSDNGFALADAQVSLVPVQDPGVAPQPKGKKSKAAWTATTSPRGEYAFRVSTAAMKYRISVSAKGFQKAEKVVEIQGGPERVDATFTLSPESKH